MDQKEYQEKLKVLEKEFNQKATALSIECGLSQKKYNIGDIITNGIWTIKVEAVRAYLGLEKCPMPVYHGASLTEDLVPKKNKEKGSIYGNDDVTLIKSNTDENKDW